MSLLFILQVSANGGPQPQSTIEFSIGDVDVGSVSHSGLVEALKLGSTKLRGSAVGYSNGRRVVYSEVSGE